MAHGGRGRERDVPRNRLPMGLTPHLSSVVSKQSIWANTSAISSFSFCGHTYKGQPGGLTLLMVRACPSAFSAPPLPCAFLSSKQELSTSVWLLRLYQPSSQGWESLCTHLTLFPACFYFPRDQEVSARCSHQQALTPPGWQLPIEAGAALPCSEFLRGSPWSTRAWTPPLLWHHIFPVTCQ